MAPGPSPRARVAQWCRAELLDTTGVHLPSLARAAAHEFGGDPAFVEEFLTNQFLPIVQAVAQQVVAETRQRVIVLGDTMLPREGARKALIVKGARWRGWLEFNGERHVPLGLMTRRDLIAAAVVRERRGNHELALATIWRGLADGLADDAQLVGECYDDATIAAAVADLAPDLATSLFDGPRPVADDDGDDGDPEDDGTDTARASA